MSVKARLPVEVNVPDLEALAAVMRLHPNLQVEVVPSIRLEGVLITAETWQEVADLVIAALKLKINTPAKNESPTITRGAEGRPTPDLGPDQSSSDLNTPAGGNQGAEAEH